MSELKVSYEQLIAYAAGELEPDEMARIEAYLKTSPGAAATVALFRSVAETLRTDDTQAPAEETVRAAKAIFRQQRARPRASWLAELQRVVAQLIYDSRPTAALAGVRGRHELYQLGFESDLADVDLEIEPAPQPEQRRRLRGQVSPHGDLAADAVALAELGSLEPLMIQQPDEHGVFVLSAAPGRYDLWVSLKGAMLVLPDVEVE